MIDPVGATRVRRLPVPAVCQNAATDCGGGAHVTWAGRETDTVVSENSLEGEFALPFQFTLQVADAPWLAGGVQTDNLWMRKQPKKLLTVVFATEHMVPAAQRILVGVNTVDVPDVLTKR
jgi:hypothetical protein